MIVRMTRIKKFLDNNMFYGILKNKLGSRPEELAGFYGKEVF